MPKTSKTTIDVLGTAVTVLSQASDDYISLTDIAKHKEPDRSDQVIQNLTFRRSLVEFARNFPAVSRRQDSRGASASMSRSVSISQARSSFLTFR